MDSRAATIKEGLLAELLGDVDKLVARLEEADTGLSHKLGPGLAQTVGEAERHIVDTVRSASAALERSASGEREKWVREARAATIALGKVADGLAARGRSMLLTAVAVGACSGVAGGLVVAFALKAI